MIRALAVCAVAALAAVAPALADGDPASDVIFQQMVFVPFGANQHSAAVKELQDTVYAANAAGVPVRVAVIATKADLGAVPGLFGMPERYARFLGGEITFGWKGLVLIAMPAGLAISKSFHPAPREQAIVSKVKPGSGVDGLAQSAAEAVRRLAAARGKTLHVIRPSTGGGSGGSETRDRIVIGVAAAAGAAVIAALVLLRRRRASRPRG